MVKADQRLSLVEHLNELRKRLFLAVLGTVLCMIVAAVFNDNVFGLLLHPLPEEMRQITTFSPTEPFLISLRIWLYSGLILASPLLIYEFWAFVGPAFTPGEKRHIVPVAGICSALFLTGVAFGYLFVLPRGLDVLLGWNSDFLSVQNRAQDYLSFVAWFLLAFGAVFEMPVIIVAAVRLGAVDRRFLRKNRKYAILVNALVAALATPSQDIFSMLAMFVPLLILYEASILIARFFEPERRRAKAAARAAAAEHPAGEGQAD